MRGVLFSFPLPPLHLRIRSLGSVRACPQIGMHARTRGVFFNLLSTYTHDQELHESCVNTTGTNRRDSIQTICGLDHISVDEPALLLLPLLLPRGQMLPPDAIQSSSLMVPTLISLSAERALTYSGCFLVYGVVCVQFPPHSRTRLGQFGKSIRAAGIICAEGRFYCTLLYDSSGSVCVNYASALLYFFFLFE